MSYKATNKANQQVQDAIAKSNKTLTDALTPISGMYAPYAALGKQAADRYANMQPSNIAGGFSNLSPMFNSLGSGKGINLAQMSKLGYK